MRAYIQLFIRGDITIPHSRMTKNMLVKHLYPVCDKYATSHKRLFVPSIGGIGLLCNITKVTNWVTDPFRWLCELL